MRWNVLFLVTLSGAPRANSVCWLQLGKSTSRGAVLPHGQNLRPARVMLAALRDYAGVGDVQC